MVHDYTEECNNGKRFNHPIDRATTIIILCAKRKFETLSLVGDEGILKKRILSIFSETPPERMKRKTTKKTKFPNTTEKRQCSNTNESRFARKGMSLNYLPLIHLNDAGRGVTMAKAQMMDMQYHYTNHSID